MENGRKKCTHVTQVKLSKYEQGVTIDKILYISIIGNPLYLISNLPDIRVKANGKS